MVYKLTGILSFIVVLFVVSCNSGDNEKISSDVVFNSNSADERDVTDLPVLSFEKEEHDFGKVIEGEVVSFGFKFINEGKSDLLIAGVSASCGCTATQYPHKPISPGDSDIIFVTFDSNGRRGFQNKTVTVLSNNEPNKMILRIKAKVDNN